MKVKDKKSRKTKNINLVIVGSIALDTIITPKSKMKGLLGGSLSYACLAASFLERCGMVGIVGSDFPKKHIQLYRKSGIDILGLHIAKGKTFRWTGEYSGNMNERRTISTELNVFANFSPEIPPAYRNAPFVLLCNIAPQLQLRVLSQINKPAFVIADTMDLWIRNEPVALKKIIQSIDMLTINESEARLLTGKYDIRQYTKALHSMGVKWVVIKKGEHGSVLSVNKRFFFIPSYPVHQTIDPTGAGDTFAGALIGWLANTQNIELTNVLSGILYATAMASFCVEGFGLSKLIKLRFGRQKNSQLFERIIEISSSMTFPNVPKTPQD